MTLEHSPFEVREELGCLDRTGQLLPDGGEGVARKLIARVRLGWESEAESAHGGRACRERDLAYVARCVGTTRQ